MGAVSKSTYIPPVFILNAGKFAVIGGGVAAASAAAAAAAAGEAAKNAAKAKSRAQAVAFRTEIKQKMLKQLGVL